MGTAGSSYCVQKIIARRTHHPRGWVKSKFFREPMLNHKHDARSHESYNRVARQQKCQLHDDAQRIRFGERQPSQPQTGGMGGGR